MTHRGLGLEETPAHSLLFAPGTWKTALGSLGQKEAFVTCPTLSNLMPADWLLHSCPCLGITGRREAGHPLRGRGQR